MKKGGYYAIALAGVVVFGLGLYFIKAFALPEGVLRVLPFICIGVGGGMFGYGLGEVFGKMAREKDPALAKRLDIEQKDERNVTHANASKAKGFSMMTYVFGALMIAYALMGIAVEVIVPFVIAYLFVHFYAIYHQVKMNKEQ